MKDNSAYVIRLELLKLAQSIESERTMTERIRLENDWNSNRTFLENQNKMAPAFPELESVDHVRIMQVAKSLNKFVSGEEV
jgi:hypothetical protein